MTGDGTGRVVGVSRFPPDPAVGGAVREFVTAHLGELDMDARGDDVQLAVTELVTNVILHARTGFEVRLAALPDGARIEVADGSPVLPSPAALDSAALSGRGLMLVQSIASRWGVEPVPDDGKVVWCELSRAEVDVDVPVDVDALLALWDEEPPSSPALVEVDVPDLPVRELVAAKAHMEDLLRELQLILLAHPDPSATPPDLLPFTQLARRLDDAARVFGEGRRQVRQQALAALARQLDVVTLHLRLSPDTASAAVEYRQAVEEAERLSRTSVHLLPCQDTMEVYTEVRRRYLGAVTDRLSPTTSHDG